MIAAIWREKLKSERPARAADLFVFYKGNEILREF